MKRFYRTVLIAIVCAVAAPWAQAEAPNAVIAQADAASGAPEKASPQGKPAPMREFATPPVPEFMLHKSSKPMTVEEMQRQAHEASEKARREREARQKSADPAK